MKKRIICFLLVLCLCVPAACSRKDEPDAIFPTPDSSANEASATLPDENPEDPDEGEDTTGNAGITDPGNAEENPAGRAADEGSTDPGNAGEDPAGRAADEESTDPEGAGVDPTDTPSPTEAPIPEDRILEWNESWEYADYSAIHEDCPKLCFSHAEDRKDIVISVNAGHGTPGGNKVKTLCHPDGSAKVTGGSTSAGETKAAAVSSGTTFLDGTTEGEANLTLAIILRDMLLEEGYDVLMIREDNDTQLDNIARTVFSNNNADCHIALHYDSSESDKGFFFIGVPDIASYRSMEPVASHWKSHNVLGEALLEGVRDAGVRICGNGNIPLDLTQTSYSTIPSVDVEVGDRASDYGEETQRKIARGLVAGINIFFEGE